MLGGHFDLVPHFVLWRSIIFYVIWTAKIYSKLNSNRESSQKVMKCNKKNHNLGGFQSESYLRAFRHWIKKPKRFIDSYIVSYKNPKFEDCRFENGENTRLRRMDRYKCKIAILKIGSILNWIILGLRNMKVLNFARPKWDYLLKSVEKWLCKTWKNKTVVGGAILNYSSILKFWKKVTSTIFFVCIDVLKSKVLWFRWKLTELWNICVARKGFAHKCSPITRLFGIFLEKIWFFIILSDLPFLKFTYYWVKV
jgi:hypothetical protein